MTLHKIVRGVVGVGLTASIVVMLGCGSSTKTVDNSADAGIGADAAALDARADAGPAAVDAGPSAVDAGQPTADATANAAVDAVPVIPDATTISDAAPDATITDAATDANPTDPNNCGVTGHTCLGATCANSMCTAAEVDPGGVTNIGDITADNLFVYYTGFVGTGADAHQLWRMPIGLAGGMASSLAILDTGPEPASEFDFSSNLFYLVDNNTNNSIDGGSRISEYGAVPYAQATLVHNLDTPTTAIFVYNEEVYWATGVNGGEIDKMSIASLLVTAITIGAGDVEYMKTDGTNVYWTGGGMLQMAPMSGGATVFLGNVSYGVNDLSQFAIDSSNIYSQNDHFEIAATSLTGSPRTTTTLDGTTATSGMAVDGNYIYVGYATSLLAFPKIGGQPITLWESDFPSLPNGCLRSSIVSRLTIVVDYIYFSVVSHNSCTNAVVSEGIYRVPKL